MAGTINVKIPEKVFFSKKPESYEVKNDFYFTIYKTAAGNTELEKNVITKKGEVYPTIYIKGFEKLFKDENTLVAFLKLFYSTEVATSKLWSIKYGKFRNSEEKCVVITTVAVSLPNDFSIGFKLSQKCTFTTVPENLQSITLQVYVDDFNEFFSDVPKQLDYNLTLEAGYAAYIQKFGAYRANPDPQKEPFRVTSVPKGETCDISWKIDEDEMASVFLYDENGAVVANLPPYTVRIDKDNKFTLAASNDYCSVSESLIVRRTLWRNKENMLVEFPETDTKGHFKFYRDYGGTYYLYVHPNLYKSVDLKTWSVHSVNALAPDDFSFYSSAFYECRFSVCYLSATAFTYCELNLNGMEWKKSKINIEASFAYSLLSNSQKTVIALGKQNIICFFDLIGGRLLNDRFLKMPADSIVKGMDILDDNGKSYLAVLNNKRAYFYDLADDFKNNVFECPNAKDNSICLVKSNALYIALNGYMFEVSDRDKFTDTNFFPEYKEGVRPVIGGADIETVMGVFQTEGGSINTDSIIEVWEYKF